MADADFAQALHGFDHCIGVEQHYAFGQFQFQPFRFEPGCCERLLDHGMNIAILELSRRQVHSHAYGWQTLILPTAVDAAGFVHGPFAHIPDQACFFQQRNEFQRRNQSMLGPVPAYQCLGANDSAADQVDLRLIVQYELSLFQGATQCIFQVEAPLRAMFHRRGKKPVHATGIARLHVGGQHGVMEQGMHRPILRIVGDTDIGFKVDFTPINGNYF